MKFKDENSFEERLEESEKLKKKWTGRVPIVIENHHRSNLPELQKKRFMVLKTQTIRVLLSNIRRLMKLSEADSVFLFANSTELVSGEQTIGVVYELLGDEDGFMYFLLSHQESMG